MPQRSHASSQHHCWPLSPSSFLLHLSSSLLFFFISSSISSPSSPSSPSPCLSRSARRPQPPSLASSPSPRRRPLSTPSIPLDAACTTMHIFLLHSTCTTMHIFAAPPTSIISSTTPPPPPLHNNNNTFTAWAVTALDTLSIFPTTAATPRHPYTTTTTPSPPVLNFLVKIFECTLGSNSKYNLKLGGDLKMVVSMATGMEPSAQRLLFRGKEREDGDHLHMVGVRDKDKVLLLEDPAIKERKLMMLAMQRSQVIRV